MRQLQRIALHRLGTLGAVRNACRVAEVHNCFIWQPITERLDHGQPADAGIKNADRSRVAHAAGTLMALTTGCNCVASPFQRGRLGEGWTCNVKRSLTSFLSPSPRERRHSARMRLASCKHSTLSDD